MPNDVRMLIRMAEPQTTSGTVPQFALRHRMGLALETAGIARDEMAAELGVHKNTVGNWMRGVVPPPRAALIAWALRCGVPFDWLISGTQPKEYPDTPGGHVARCIRGPWGIEPTADVEEQAA